MLYEISWVLTVGSKKKKNTLENNVDILDLDYDLWVGSFCYGEWASQVALVVKNLPANKGDKRHGFKPWVGKIPWRRAWQPTPIFLPGEFHGQRSPGGLQSMGSQSVRHDWVTMCMHTHWNPAHGDVTRSSVLACWRGARLGTWTPHTHGYCPTSWVVDGPERPCPSPQQHSQASCTSEPRLSLTVKDH